MQQVLNIIEKMRYLILISDISLNSTFAFTRWFGESKPKEELEKNKVKKRLKKEIIFLFMLNA